MLTMATSIEYYVLLVLPLTILGAMFRWLLPAAGLAALVPVLASVAAAWQVRLPERKRRLWSRPIVAMLFLLQPLVRGWARYQGRLFLPQTPRRVRRDFRALSEMPRGAPPEQVVFQAPKGLDRQRFLEQLTRRFAAGGWQFRTDTGWSPWDLEVYGSRWSKLQLTTAAEYEPDGRPWIRCRLRAALPLPARMALATWSGLAVLWMGLHEPNRPAEWLALLLPIAFAVFLRWDQRRLQREAVVFIRRVAEELGMKSAPTVPATTEQRKAEKPNS
jgi:hypothetical protein